MNESPHVVVVGSLNVDLVAAVERLPRPGETVSARELVRRPGGKGANQALGALAGGAAVSLVGRLGEDRDGAAYREALDRRGIDVTHLTTTPGTGSGMALVMVDAQGENSIVVVAGANHRVGTEDVDRARDVIAAAQVLVLQLELPLPVVSHAASVAARSGTRVLLNPSPLVPLPDSLLAVSDPLVVNQHEARDLLVHSGSEAPTGQDDLAAAVSVAQRLRALGPRSVTLTLGAEGAVWVDEGGLATAPARAAQVVDTTGAGDAFAGALAAALASGRSGQQALEAAVAAGGEAVGHVGAQPWTL